MIVGTVLKITSVASIQPDNGTISIWDSGDVLIVDEQAMTDEGDRVFTYIHQTDPTDTSGKWKTICTMHSGANDAESKKTFILESR